MNSLPSIYTTQLVNFALNPVYVELPVMVPSVTKRTNMKRPPLDAVNTAG